METEGIAHRRAEATEDGGHAAVSHIGRGHERAVAGRFQALLIFAVYYYCYFVAFFLLDHVVSGVLLHFEVQHFREPVLRPGNTRDDDQPWGGLHHSRRRRRRLVTPLRSPLFVATTFLIAAKVTLFFAIIVTTSSFFFG